MMEHLPNLMREEATEVQKTWWVLIMSNRKRPNTRHIIIKMAKFKDKERILKAAMEKQVVTYKVASTKLAADFSTETLEVTRE